MKPHKFKELLDRYSKKECSASEEKLILDWYERIGKNQKEHIHLENMDALEANLWTKINPQSGIQKINNFYFLKIAASFLLIAVVGSGLFYFLNKSRFYNEIVASELKNKFQDKSLTRFVNNENVTKVIMLADGSYVTVKPKSEIRFSKNFNSERREVYLLGEAFFKVKRDTLRPFLVYANEVVTKVLGTSFNIKAYSSEKQVTVAVKTGKVSVYTNNENEVLNIESEKAVILTPNQQIVYDRDNDKVMRQLVKAPEIILSKPTELKMQYESAPVTEIFEVLEENYGVHIQYDDEILKGCVLTTSMTDEGLYQRIEVICKAINAEYVITDAEIIITSEGCK